MTIRQIYSYCVEELKNSDEKYIDTEILLAYVLKKDRLYIKLNLDEDISEEEEKNIKKYISQLKNDKPIHYITKNRDFFGHDFFVEENVLIPRSDTEFLVQESIKNLKNSFNKSINGLEMGVGSGIISISLLKFIDKLNMTAVDINHKAIKLTLKNAQNLNVENRLKVLYSDLYENIDFKGFDFIVSNPPYIPTRDISELDNKIKLYEPINALDGKESGLYFYEKIIQNSRTYLNKNFFIFFEIGYNQGDDIKNLFTKYNFNNDVEIIKDYNGNDRVVIYKEFCGD